VEGEPEEEAVGCGRWTLRVAFCSLHISFRPLYRCSSPCCGRKKSEQNASHSDLSLGIQAGSYEFPPRYDDEHLIYLYYYYY
jgi:hypothetical protein